jgi:DNA-binding NtrC family response regulator
VRVLIIDDSVFSRGVLRHHLECLSCAVVAEAENTLQALDLFHTVRPNLVILDVAVAQTGGISAMALFRIIRNEPPQTPVLVISGSAFHEACSCFLQEGALDYLVKPFGSQSFEQVGNRLVELFPELAERPARADAASVGY